MHGTSTIPLGQAVRHEWALDWSQLTVNHGAFGATPKVVMAAQTAWRDKMEAQPSVFMRSILPNALRASATALAAFLKVEGQDVTFVDNATTGCNAVLRSLDLKPGDDILLHGQAYGAVANTARYVAARTGARVVIAELQFPDVDPGGFVGRFAACLTPQTRIAIIDHVTSPSALVLPVADIARICREAGVPLLVDGAHGPGQVEIDLPAIDADWYVGNCHKWLAAPKGCAFLWARRDRQANLHPTTISHGFGGGYLAEFDWTGTRDATAQLSIEAALAFHEHLGGQALRHRNIALAREAGELLAGHLGTTVGNAGHEAAMAMVRLPLQSGPFTKERATALRGRLLDEFATDAPLHAHPSGIWVRVSAHAYNEIGDYEKLAEICSKLARTA
ncbi:aminotransferase class V-fold PLP-dependent enzyme [Bosea lathyri]|uniref:Isopenicillin-N epimerase n=1 Tax=Bosea lathyri TaxID=1036778 RepID=A0A1H5ZVX9_9HYPH|nr:aminotransferase class V-fold PLP-dependent enzyme [Bosea lathyri]SEG39945.1 isopenicillin-N epimerase [Bosea lathyri]